MECRQGVLGMLFVCNGFACMQTESAMPQEIDTSEFC